MSAPTLTPQQKDYIQVKEARKIWGTLKSTTPTAIANTIKNTHWALWPTQEESSHQEEVQNIPQQQQKVTKLWFVVHGDESMLEQLTTKWNSIEVQMAWKLEPDLCYKKNDIPTSDDQSTAATTPLSIPAPPANGKSSWDVALEGLESETQETRLSRKAQ